MLYCPSQSFCFDLFASLSYVFFEEKGIDKTNGLCNLDGFSSHVVIFPVNY